jgi:uncharacterized protein (DUF1684 family)
MLRLFAIVGILVAICATACDGQTYKDTIRQWQHHYKAEFLTDERSPVKSADTGFIRFFPINEKWSVLAKVEMTPDAKAFDMATHSGKTKKFRQWAVLRFNDAVTRGMVERRLSAYERVDRPDSDTLARQTLFIPFNDATNGKETYGGGRYMDIPKAAVKDGYLILDFNKAYSPYCAFGEGFSCPIPPMENHLTNSIKAGEKVWGKGGEH